MNKIAIFTDSGCQIEIRDEHEGIYIAPLSITMRDRAYLDQIETTSLNVFKEMEKEDQIVLTSQPPLGEMISVLQDIKRDGYHEVIGISIASGLSSTIVSMKAAAKEAGLPITLIDSHATARIQRVLVETAKKLIEQNKTAQEIKEILDQMVQSSLLLLWFLILNI